MPDRAEALTLPIFGVPVRFESDDPGILALVEESFGSWNGLGVPATGAPLTVRLHLADGDEQGAVRPDVAVRILPDRRRMILSTPGSVGHADPDRGEAIGHMTRAFLADGLHARVAFIEALTLRMMGARDRIPFHAALVGKADAGLLFTGPSGAGKSSLAYACARAGLRVVAEDIVWVERGSATRVWGRAERLHLLPTAVALFPELADAPVTIQPNGKAKIAVDLRTLGAVGTPWMDRTGVCIVARSGGPATLEPLDPRRAVVELRAQLEPGFDLFGEEGEATLRALAAGGCWRLDPGPRPADALPLIEAARAQVGSGAR